MADPGDLEAQLAQIAVGVAQLDPTLLQSLPPNLRVMLANLSTPLVVHLQESYSPSEAKTVLKRFAFYMGLLQDDKDFATDTELSADNPLIALRYVFAGRDLLGDLKSFGSSRSSHPSIAYVKRIFDLVVTPQLFDFLRGLDEFKNFSDFTDLSWLPFPLGKREVWSLYDAADALLRNYRITVAKNVLDRVVSVMPEFTLPGDVDLTNQARQAIDQLANSIGDVEGVVNEIYRSHCTPDAEKVLWKLDDRLRDLMNHAANYLVQFSEKRIDHVSPGRQVGQAPQVVTAFSEQSISDFGTDDPRDWQCPTLG